MAGIALLCSDLLFGSKVEGGLAAAGHDVHRFDAEDEARQACDWADVLVVDLTTDDFDGATLVESMRMGGELAHTRTLGFYSHIEHKTKERAQEAGFDLVVPRSRMARDMAGLVLGLAGQ